LHNNLPAPTNPSTRAGEKKRPATVRDYCTSTAGEGSATSRLQNLQILLPRAPARATWPRHTRKHQPLFPSWQKTFSFLFWFSRFFLLLPDAESTWETSTRHGQDMGLVCANAACQITVRAPHPRPVIYRFRFCARAKKDDIIFLTAPP